MIRYYPVILACVFFSLLPPAQSVLAQPDTFTVSGVMAHTDLEGGCWYLNTANGKKYELVGDKELIESTHDVGKAVMLRVRPAVGRASICMVGTIVEVVEQVQELRHPTDPVVEDVTLIGVMHKNKNGKWYAKTKQGIIYRFEHPLPAKYRKSGARINGRWRAELIQFGTNATRGVVLDDLRKLPNGKTPRIIEKKYDAR